MRALHLGEDPAPLLGPGDGGAIVLVQHLGEVGEPLVELGPIAEWLSVGRRMWSIEARATMAASPDVVGEGRG